MPRKAEPKEDKKRMQGELRDVMGCMSCGLPVETEARKAVVGIGEVCPHCVDKQGHLKSYNEVFENLTTDYFMKKQKMVRSQAENAAREQMRKVPAWKDE